MSAMRDLVKQTAGRLGYTVKRSSPTPFPELKGLARYVAQTVTLSGHPFQITDAPAFLASYQEIFVDQIYRFDTPNPQPVIIDCGANYGVAVAYWKSQYPDCMITAVEADPAIFAILKANSEAAEWANTMLINKAVSDSGEPLTFFSEGADCGRTYSNPGAKGQCTVAAIMFDELIGEQHVDMLKIDIEGAETAALAQCTQLAKVRQMFIEYHSFADSPQTLAELFAILKDNGFRVYVHSQLCSPAPLTVDLVHMGMDLTLNIFARKVD